MNPRKAPRVARKFADSECDSVKEDDDLADDVRMLLSGLGLPSDYLDKSESDDD